MKGFYGNQLQTYHKLTDQQAQTYRMWLVFIR